MVSEPRIDMILPAIKRLVRRSPRLTRALGAVYSLVSGPFPGSQEYWVKRYEKGGNSGPGSYSELAKFKARVLNDFVRNEHVQSVIEFGCGDGNQLETRRVPQLSRLRCEPGRRGTLPRALHVGLVQGLRAAR